MKSEKGKLRKMTEFAEELPKDVEKDDDDERTNATNESSSIPIRIPIVSSDSDDEEKSKIIRTVRIACISDTHSLHGELEMPSNIDVLIHAGDFSRMGRVADIESFNLWLATLPIKHRIVVLGNHEGGVFRRVDPAAMVTNATAVLQGSGVTLPDELGALRVWGTRFAWPMHANSPCKNPENTSIPEGTDIVIAHGPVFGFVDGGGSGCPELRDELLTRVRPKLFVCGHIHNSYGSTVCKKTGIRFVNAASQKFGGGVNAPIVVEMEAMVSRTEETRDENWRIENEKEN
jgi:predicted phosphodiesterase